MILAHAVTGANECGSHVRKPKTKALGLLGFTRCGDAVGFPHGARSPGALNFENTA